MNKRIRYTMNDIAKEQFYQMPKFLFEGEFEELSNNARVLYTQLKDRHRLSFKNGWSNENNEVYLIFTREDMAKMLGCSQPTIRKSLMQLKDYKLIEEERLGINKANRIYLKTVDVENIGLKKTFTPECNDISVMKEKDYLSRMQGIFTQECKSLSCNKTDISQTDFSNLSINLEHDEDGLVDNKKNRMKFENQIEFAVFKDIYPNNHVVDDILETIIDVMTSSATTIRVNQEDKPIGDVKSAFSKLDFHHIEYVLRCLETQTKKANNVRALLITALYNAPNTINTYYSNLVSHDRANYRKFKEEDSIED